MAKTKHLKYERVRHLPNVFIPAPGRDDEDYPWLTGIGTGRDLILELGCGKGEHALALAAAHPETLVVGVDLKSHRICTGGEAAVALGLSNLFFLRAGVEALLTYFKRESVREIWITFPDPHPKQREIKHRLTAPGFMAAYAALLSPGGLVHLKTDSDLFYTYTLGTVEDWGGVIDARIEDLHGCGSGQPEPAGVFSAFEKKAIARHQTIKYLRFTLN